MHNTVRELLITLEEIKLKSWNDNFVLIIKDQITGKVKNRKVNKSNTFSICDGVLMYAVRIVILISLRKCMLKEYHIGQPEISRMKSLIRCYTYRLKMDEDIQNLIKSCKGCALAVKSPSD